MDARQSCTLIFFLNCGRFMERKDEVGGAGGRAVISEELQRVPPQQVVAERATAPDHRLTREGLLWCSRVGSCSMWTSQSMMLNC